jgi:FkbM family methyltransferase
VGVGASDTSGTLPFTMFSRDDRSSFTPTPEAAKANGMRQVEVPVTTLNEVARTGNAPCPDIVKIDAEGFDLSSSPGLPSWLVRPTSFCSRRQSVET